MEQWKQRRAEIERELERVWVQGGDELGPPPYAETVDVGSSMEGSGEADESIVSESSPVAEDEGVRAGESGQGEGLFGSSSMSSSWNPALRPS